MGLKEKIIYGTGTAYVLGRAFILIVLAVLVVHYFLFTIFVISGPSMEPNFFDKEVVIINRFNLFTNRFVRGEPMVLKFPGDPEHKKYIKRLIGLPGDKVEIRSNQVYVNDRILTESYLEPGTETIPMGEKDSWVLGPGEFFLLGDNRFNSSDSRIWGIAERKDMVGPVKMILFPLKRFQFVAVPPY